MNAYHGPAEALAGDRVIIEDLRVPASIGIYPHEKVQKQTIALDIEMGLATQVCFGSDRVEDTIDYAAVADAVRELAASRHFNLIEYLAERISNVIFDNFGASWVKVRISKIGVIPDARCAAVSITRLNARSFSVAFSSISSTSAQNEEQA
jgi:dihydroneopterin aldolase